MIRNIRFGNLYSDCTQQQNQQNHQQKQILIDKNYKEIYSHELAHKTAGGALAGSIVIEKNSDGIPIGGHVSIKMPTLNQNNPQKTIDEANIVIRSAMAPANPSSQDFKVAAQARAIKSEAQNLLSSNGKKLNIIG